MKLYFPDDLIGKYGLGEENKKAFHYVRNCVFANNGDIANADTRMALLDAGKVSFPVSINEGGSKNCYVVSPMAAYVEYAREEMMRLRLEFVKLPLSILLVALERILRVMSLDRIFYGVL